MTAKVTDDYRGKLRLWAAYPKVVPWQKPAGIPAFASRKFSSHEEMNCWKRELLREMARHGGSRG